MDTYWVPGVNHLETYGRWAFAEFTEVYQSEGFQGEDRRRVRQDDFEGRPAMTRSLLPGDYSAFLAALKARISHARISAARKVNRELVLLYWDIGQGIVEKQKAAGWGAAVVERLAAVLGAEFPNMR